MKLMKLFANFTFYLKKSIKKIMKKETNYLACMLFGAAAGFVVGIMMAPDKGCNTRKKIKDKMDEYKEKAEDLVDNLKYEGENLVNDIKGKGKNLIKEGREYAKRGKDYLKSQAKIEEEDSFI